MNASFNKIAASVALVIGLGTCSGAMAAQQASLQVSGMIKPGSCDISINGGSAVDYGDINVASLNKDKFTELAVKSAKLNIDCTAPTLFAVRSTDIAEGAAADLGTTIGIDYPNFFSLGETASGKIIGGYIISVAAAKTLVDGAQPKAMVYSEDQGTTWKSIATNFMTPSAGELMSWDASGTGKAEIAQNVSFDMDISPKIAALNTLGSADEIQLGGNATFDVVYL